MQSRNRRLKTEVRKVAVLIDKKKSEPKLRPTDRASFSWISRQRKKKCKCRPISRRLRKENCKVNLTKWPWRTQATVRARVVSNATTRDTHRSRVIS